MEKPSYIDRINAFWNWRLFNPVPDKAVALYFAILHCANRAGFPDEVYIPNSTLLSLVDMERRDLYRIRNILVQSGLVAIGKGHKGQAASYQLRPISDIYGTNLDTNPVTNPVTNVVTNVVTNPVTNPDTIYRQRQRDKTKTNNPPNPPAGGVRGQAKAALFDEFWSLYPRKVGKGDARRAWDKLALTDELADTILTAVRVQQGWDQWQRDGGRYIPHPATWLNQQRWEDEGLQIVDMEEERRKAELAAWMESDEL